MVRRIIHFRGYFPPLVFGIPFAVGVVDRYTTPSIIAEETMIPALRGLFSKPAENVPDKSELFPEELFRELLTIERKRSERSKRPFLLMLIDISALFPKNGQKSRIMNVFYAVQSSTREIDIKGWYHEARVFGIIFTELDAAGQESVLSKINANLEKYLEPSEVKLVRIILSCFPDAGGGQADIGDTGELFYSRSENKKKTDDLFSLRRAMDVSGSLFILTALSVLLGVIAVLIKISSKGPVIHKQIRLGQGGRKFTFYKFRSMHADADSSLHERYVRFLIQRENHGADENKQVWKKLKDDSRVTPFGRFLRKTSLDELPQFFNVLKGDMTLVGPRPPIPYEFDHYESWHKRRVLECKPGITGYWQVECRGETTFDNMVRMDIHYCQERSFWLDLKLLVKTPWAILTTRGAG